MNTKDFFYIIGIVGSIVGIIISTYFSYKTSKNLKVKQFRDTLYSERIKSIDQLSRELALIENRLTWLSPKQQSLDIESLKVIKDIIDNSYLLLKQKCIMLPLNILNDITDTLSSASKFLETYNTTNDEIRNNNLDEFHRNYKNFIQSSRKELGVEKLGSKVQKIINNS